MKGNPRIKQNFGKIIGQLRAERGESQQIVADHCDLERAYISRLERGISEPSIGTIFKLADYFGLTPGELTDKVYSLTRRAKK
jgi:transcriptional regulator with XRE-family HTH domain